MWTIRSFKKAILVLMISSLTAMTWAAPFQVKSKQIHFTSSPLETHIQIISEKKLPYTLVSQSADRIEIQLSVKDSKKAITTDFVQAKNIEQVILKPVSRNKIQMVIRGHQLGEAVVDYAKYAPKVNHPVRPIHTKSPLSVAEKTETFSLEEMQRAPKSEPVKKVETPSLAKGLTQSAESFLQELEATPIENSMDDAIVLEDEGGSQEETGSSQLTRESVNNAVLGTLSSVKKVLGKFDKAIYFKLLVVFGSFIFVFHLLQSKKSNPFSSEMETRQSGLFSNVMKSVLQFFRIQPKAKKQKKGLNRRSASAQTRQPALNQSPIGLSGFDHGQQPVAQRPQQQPVNRRQAVNEYAKNARKPVRQQPKHQKTELEREMKRSLSMRQAIDKTHNRQAAPQQPAVRQNASRPQKPLRASQQKFVPNQYALKQPPKAPAQTLSGEFPSNNDGVLDFLRSVADLMEDEKPNLAKGIKKGLSST